MRRHTESVAKRRTDVPRKVYPPKPTSRRCIPLQPQSGGNALVEYYVDRTTRMCIAPVAYKSTRGWRKLVHTRLPPASECSREARFEVQRTQNCGSQRANVPGELCQTAHEVGTVACKLDENESLKIYVKRLPWECPRQKPRGAPYHLWRRGYRTPWTNTPLVAARAVVKVA